MAVKHQEAHDRMLASLPVTTHLRKAAPPSRTTEERKAATLKMLATKKLTPHTNVWLEKPAPTRAYRRR